MTYLHNETNLQQLIGPEVFKSGRVGEQLVSYTKILESVHMKISPLTPLSNKYPQL